MKRRVHSKLQYKHCTVRNKRYARKRKGVHVVVALSPCAVSDPDDDVAGLRLGSDTNCAWIVQGSSCRSRVGTPSRPCRKGTTRPFAR